MVNQGWVVRSLMTAVFSIAIAASGCTTDPAGTGGTGGGGTGGMGGGGAGGDGGMGGGGAGGDGGMGGGMPGLTVTADPSCAGGSAQCNEVNNVVFETTQEVTLTASDPTATIYYTTDASPVTYEAVEGAGGAGGEGGAAGAGGAGGAAGGASITQKQEEPSTVTTLSDSAQEYTGPITLEENTVLKFLAQAEDGTFGEESVEGYVKASNATEEQWAVSGHGAITEEPWRHWDEDADADTGELDLSVQTSCARCHSPEGFLEYAETGEDPVSTPAPLPVGLACNACHEGGAFPNIYGEDGMGPMAMYPALEPVEFPSTLTATYENASNICMTCHQGRNWGGAVDEKVDDCIAENPACDEECTPAEGAGGAGGAGGASGCPGVGFTNIHYYAAAATVFGSEVEGGYQYEGQEYSGENAWPSAHEGSLDDCLGCHMRLGDNAPNHVFLPEVSDCGPCHSGASFEELSNGPGENYTQIQTLLGELLTQLETYTTELGNPITYNPDRYPYWFDSEGNRYSFDGPSSRGAYNYTTGEKDPGNFVHNADYTLQLLYDSIVDLGGTPSVERPAVAAP